MPITQIYTLYCNFIDVSSDIRHEVVARHILDYAKHRGASALAVLETLKALTHSR